MHEVQSVAYQAIHDWPISTVDFNLNFCTIKHRFDYTGHFWRTGLCLYGQLHLTLIHLQFDISANVIGIRAAQSPKCIVWCVFDCTLNHLSLYLQGDQLNKGNSVINYIFGCKLSEPICCFIYGTRLYGIHCTR
jgi:hypothetical protein